MRYLSREEGAEPDEGAGPVEKKSKIDKFENCAIICTHLNDKERSVSTLSFIQRLSLIQSL